MAENEEGSGVGNSLFEIILNETEEITSTEAITAILEGITLEMNNNDSDIEIRNNTLSSTTTSTTTSATTTTTTTTKI